MFPIYHIDIQQSRENFDNNDIIWHTAIVRLLDPLEKIKIETVIGIMKGDFNMNFKLEFIEDKVEFFEANDLNTLEKKVNEQIEINKSILLSVHSVSHQMHIDENGKKYFSAVVHFKVKK